MLKTGFKAPLCTMKALGDEPNEATFRAASKDNGATLPPFYGRDNHEPSARFVFKHPRPFMRSSASHEM